MATDTRAGWKAGRMAADGSVGGGDGQVGRQGVRTRWSEVDAVHAGRMATGGSVGGDDRQAIRMSADRWGFTCMLEGDRQVMHGHGEVFNVPFLYH